VKMFIPKETEIAESTTPEFEATSPATPTVVVAETEVAEKKKHISFAFAKRHQILLGKEQDDAYIMYCGPDVKPQILTEMRRYLQKPLKLQMCNPEEFNRRLQENYEQGSNEASLMADELGEELDLTSVAQELAEPEDLLEAADDAPIIRLINAILTEAIKEGASDIHIEPYENRLIVRLRVDGVLRQVLEQQKAITGLIVSRIKVMAKLDIAEKRLPQDGRISLRIAGRSVDVRVSTMPSSHGERVVLRLLDKQAGRIDLQRLGMDPDSMEVMYRIIKKPHGIILVTGPTGSGKTTSLYAVLTKLNDRQRNIMTVEDPIEYYLDGVGQTNVNAKVEMTFAKGLRAILRQDPDVVMIGEIRDLETAEIAVQASLTGHLVLSTLHTNTAVGAVTRLRDMGVEPFLLSSSLVGVVAQRLVRVLCPECKKPVKATARDCAALGFEQSNAPTIFQPQGCESCNHLGYRGRIGIYEIIEIDDELRNMVHDGSSELQLETYARKKTPSIREDGIRRVLSGDTSIEEVLRVTREG